MKLTEKVEEVLKRYPKTRESDQLLTLYIWQIYYPQFIFLDQEGKKCVRMINILELPREDNIKRIRAKFNQDLKYMPSDAMVIKRRRQEEKWKKDLGYKVNEAGETKPVFQQTLDNL